MTIRVVIIIPGIVRIIPGTIVIIVSVAIPVIIIPITKIVPHDPVMDFHAEIAIIIIFIIALVSALIIVFHCYVFVMLTLGREINIIRSLAGLVG